MKKVHFDCPAIAAQQKSWSCRCFTNIWLQLPLYLNFTRNSSSGKNAQLLGSGSKALLTTALLEKNEPTRKIGKHLVVAVFLRASERKIWSLKFYKNTIGICLEGHPEFKVLRYSNKKSGSKASVWRITHNASARLSLSITEKRRKIDHYVTNCTLIAACALRSDFHIVAYSGHVG